MPNMPEDVLADAVKASQTMSGDYERRQFLASSIARQPVKAKSAGDVIEAAAGIAPQQQATLLVDLVRRGGLTNETAASFFPLVASMTSSYEQRRVLQTVLATGQLTEPVLVGLLKAAASITSDYDRRGAGRRHPQAAFVRRQPGAVPDRRRRDPVRTRTDPGVRGTCESRAGHQTVNFKRRTSNFELYGQRWVLTVEVIRFKV